MSTTLTTDEIESFAACANIDPRFVNGENVAHDLVAQDLLPEARVYEVRFRGTLVTVEHYALVDGAWSLLTGRCEAFNAIAVRRPRNTATAETAHRYAITADAWTTSWKFGQLVLANVDDIPWRPAGMLDDFDRVKIADVSARFADVIQPERITIEHGDVTIESYLLAAKTLVRRRLVVTQGTGALDRSDEILAEVLPTPLGRYWGTVDGRYIPND